MRPGLGEDVGEAGLPVVIDEYADWNQRSRCGEVHGEGNV